VPDQEGPNPSALILQSILAGIDLLPEHTRHVVRRILPTPRGCVVALAHAFGFPVEGTVSLFLPRPLLALVYLFSERGWMCCLFSSRSSLPVLVPVIDRGDGTIHLLSENFLVVRRSR